MIEASYANGRVTTGRPPLISPFGPRVAQWTEADQAELEVLLDEVVDQFFAPAHAGCSARPCPHLQEALEALFAWRRTRALRSRAAALRAAQDAREWLNEAAA